MSAERAVDRRSNLRIPTDLRAAWTAAGPIPESDGASGALVGRVHDVALGGLGMRTSMELHVGDRVQVRVLSDEEDVGSIGPIWATVRWQGSSPTGQMRTTGLQFDETSWWHAARLTALAYRRKDHLHASRCVDAQACPPHRFRKCPAYLAGLNCWNYPGPVPCCDKKMPKECARCPVGVMYCV